MKQKVIRYLVLVFLLSGCAVADLRTPGLLNSGMIGVAEDEGRRLLSSAVDASISDQDRRQLESFTFIARDVWRSRIIRSLTPLPVNDQGIKFIFPYRSNRMTMEFLDGPRQGDIVGVENGKTYVVQDGKRVEKKSRKTELYLVPVRGYFMWPYELLDYKVVLYAGKDEHLGQSYKKVFVSPGSLVATKDEDQFLVWINQDTGRIDYIEFTMRDLFASYKGVIQYADFRRVGSIEMPYKISLKDKMGDRKYSHEFFVDLIERK